MNRPGYKGSMHRMTVLKYVLLTGVLVFVLYHSISFRDLDAVRQETAAATFDPKQVAQTFWEELTAMQGRAVDCTRLLHLFEQDMDTAVRLYSHAVGITNTPAYLLRGEGTVLAVTDDGVQVDTGSGDAGPDIVIATGFIFGNAVRDASGILNVSDFPSSMDFNNIAAEINAIVSERVLPPFREDVQPGMRIVFTGAAEVHVQEPELHPLRVIPVTVNLP